MIWWTLLYCMLWVAVILSFIFTVAGWVSIESDGVDWWILSVCIFGCFFTVFLGWALWATYPMTALA